jgi:hypothetical protein
MLMLYLRFLRRKEHMTSPNPIITGLHGYNNTAQRWYNTRNGQFVAQQAVTDEMRVHQQATYTVLNNLTSQLYAGQVSLEQWQIGVAAELKDAHLAQALYAIGGKNNATPANYGRVGGTLADEYRYLNGFAIDIANGGVSEAQALARIQQYGNATQQSYWREYKLLSEVIYWNLNPAEHCADCLDLAGRSPYQPQDLSQVPGDGNTTCRGNCKCTLSREVVEQTVITETSEQGTE